MANPNRSDPNCSATYSIALCRKHDPSAGIVGGTRQRAALQAALDESLAAPRMAMSRLLTGIRAARQAGLVSHDEKAEIKEQLLTYGRTAAAASCACASCRGITIPAANHSHPLFHSCTPALPTLPALPMLAKLMHRYEWIGQFCEISSHVHELLNARKEMKALEGDTVDFDWTGTYHVQAGDFCAQAASKALAKLLAGEAEPGTE